MPLVIQPGTGYKRFVATFAEVAWLALADLRYPDMPAHLRRAQAAHDWQTDNVSDEDRETCETIGLATARYTYPMLRRDYTTGR